MLDYVFNVHFAFLGETQGDLLSDISVEQEPPSDTVKTQNPAIESINCKREQWREVEEKENQPNKFELMFVRVCALTFIPKEIDFVGETDKDFKINV